MSQLAGLFRKIGNSALDLVFPLDCSGCGKPGRVLCPSCIAGLPSLMPPFCSVCAQPGPSRVCRWCASAPPPIDGIRAPFRLEGTLREAIHSFKYRGLRAAAPELSRLLADYLQRNPVPGEVLVPVPLHPRRLRSRGYNQAALLGRPLMKLTGLSGEEDLLVRPRDTPAQVSTGGRLERARSMAGAFECVGDAAGLSVILLDDVTTTGSTLFACAAALKDAGAASVWGLVLAKEA